MFYKVYIYEKNIYVTINPQNQINLKNSYVWTKISYWMCYQTPANNIYLESARRDLQNDVKI